MTSRFALLAVLGCLLGPLGCASPTGPSPKPATAEIPGVFVEREGEVGTPLVRSRARCLAKIGAAPTHFFGDQVRLSLPVGLDKEVVEGAHGLASWRPLAPSCGPGMSARVFLLTYRVRTTTAASRVEWHHRVFDLFRLPDEREVQIRASDPEGDDVTMRVGFPRDPVWDDTRVYLRVLVRDSRLVAVAYMTSTRNWDALEPTFAASARSMWLRPAG